jgi:BMFP domain-containing protein YqiC
MSTNNAATQTTKSGLTRKMNNAFRKHLIEFEEGVLEAKIEAINPEKWDEICNELDDIKSDFENRMEEAELEARQEVDKRLRQFLTKEDKETVMAVAASEIASATYLARYDIEEAIKDTEMIALTHLEYVKTAPIAELKEKYAGVYDEWQEEMNKPLSERYDIVSKLDNAAELPPSAIYEAKKAELIAPKPTTCKVCGHALVNGKCQFINHKQQ